MLDIHEKPERLLSMQKDMPPTFMTIELLKEKNTQLKKKLIEKYGAMVLIDSRLEIFGYVDDVRDIVDQDKELCRSIQEIARDLTIAVELHGQDIWQMLEQFDVYYSHRLLVEVEMYRSRQQIPTLDLAKLSPPSLFERMKTFAKEHAVIFAALLCVGITASILFPLHLLSVFAAVVIMVASGLIGGSFAYLVKHPITDVPMVSDSTLASSVAPIALDSTPAAKQAANVSPIAEDDDTPGPSRSANMRSTFRSTTRVFQSTLFPAREIHDVDADLKSPPIYMPLPSSPSSAQQQNTVQSHSEHSPGRMRRS